MGRSLVRLLPVLAFGLTAFAFSSPVAAKSDIENFKVYGDKTIKDLMEASRDGAVSWKTLQKVSVDIKDTKTETLFIPEFDQSVAVLDGKEIEIEGFMFPLVPTTDIPDSGDHFLLSSIPASCPYFHIYGGQIIDVIAVDEIEFDEDEPVRLKGRLELLRDNTDGLFYRMTGVKMVN
jgi:hypothetical protein